MNKTCPICGTTFEDHSICHIGKYCNIKCQKKDYQSKNKEKIKETKRRRYYKNRPDYSMGITKNCLICGEEYQSYTPQQKYCGPICRHKGFVKNHPEVIKIHGIIHPYNGGHLYLFTHPEDFVPLCYKCHNIVHILGRNNGDLNKLVELCNFIKLMENKEFLKR